MRKQPDLTLSFGPLIQYWVTIAPADERPDDRCCEHQYVGVRIRQSVVDSDGAIIVGHIVPALTDDQISTDMLQHGQTVGDAIILNRPQCPGFGTFLY